MSSSEGHPLAKRAVARYYALLDSKTVHADDRTRAVELIAEELDVTPSLVWQWIREAAF